LAPILLAAISPLIVYVNEPGARIFIPPQDVILPSVCVIVATLAVLAIADLITRSPIHSSLIAVFFVLGIFYYWQIFFILVCAALLCLVLLKLLAKKMGSTEVGISIIFVSIILSGYYLVQFSIVTGTQSSHIASLLPPAPLSEQGGSSIRENSPDIYYIILDGYGRADALQAIHDYDNSPFISQLKQRGFIVPSLSQANYPRTLLSLASSLNMQYLDDLSTGMEGSYVWWPMEENLQHAAVRSFLEGKGYQTVAFASGWDFTDIRDGDFYMHPYAVMLRDFDKAFVQLTNLKLLRNIDWLSISFPNYATHREMIRYAFETIPEVAKLPGPKFVFSHIVSPHPPFVFESDGLPVNPAYPFSMSYAQGLFGDSASYRRSYLEQLAFVNQLTLKMIDGILANSKTPPVIIIQGDHGPGIFMNYDDLEKACLYERYSILNAYYLPGTDPTGVPADISPVNTFRLIFDTYFGTGYTLLLEKRYYSSNLDFYQFEDVTDLTEKTCELPASDIP
jgi:hypothetical protein